MVDAGKLRVNLDRVFLLEEAAEAQRVVQAGEFTGRVVIDMQAKGGGVRMADGSRSDSASIPLSPRFFPTLKTNRSNGLDTRVKRQGSLKVTYTSV